MSVNRACLINKFGRKSKRKKNSVTFRHLKTNFVSMQLKKLNVNVHVKQVYDLKKKQPTKIETNKSTIL